MSGVQSPESLDVAAVRAEFPILRREVHGKPLVYLDNAATSQKPQRVLDTLEHYYAHHNSNVHRGVHALSAEATDAYEGVRAIVQRFLNAPRREEVLFTSGTTASLNLVAQSLGRSVLKAGDRVLVSAMEHHSGIVPWQLVCEATGAKLDVLPMDEHGALRMETLDELLTDRTRIVSVVHVSNALGTVNPVAEIARKAKAIGATIVVDGAQAVPHGPVDVQALGVDFYAFSAHKVFGPTGTGVLWGRTELLDAMPPFLGGGDMIRSVSFEGSTWNALPYKFEAGTPNIAGVIGMGAGLEWFLDLGVEAAAAHEAQLLARATEGAQAIPGLRLIGTAPEKRAVLSFVMDGTHPNDIGTILDRSGIAIRTARASFAPYNTLEEVDALLAGLERVQRLFA